MSKARLIITAVVREGRSKSDVVRVVLQVARHAHVPEDGTHFDEPATLTILCAAVSGLDDADVAHLRAPADRKVRCMRTYCL
jgi:hypothetical protein